MSKDLRNAIEKISSFIENPEKRVLLIKGYDNEAKIKASLASTNKYFRKCILLVNVMKEAPRFVNDAFGGRNILPRTINSNKEYRVGNMDMAIYSYVTTSSSVYFGNDETCTIVYPIQTVLDDEKRYKDFLEKLKKINSKKIILITTNEWGIQNWKIDEVADEIFFYSVDNDNPDLMKNLKSNRAI